MKTFFYIFLSTLFSFFAISCDNTNSNHQSNYDFMNGETADCEFSTLTFLTADGSLTEIDINGLPVHTFKGADKLGADTVEIVERRGVAFKDIFAKAEISMPDDTPVNIISRDGWDPLRTRLENDTSKLPAFAFLRDYGYVYAGNAGDTDPLYPEMEGKTLIIDYNLSSDGEVPGYLGGNLPAINIFRARMLEKVDEENKGIIELDPVTK